MVVVAIREPKVRNSMGRLPEGSLKAIRDEIELLDPNELISECIYNIRNTQKDTIELNSKLAQLATQVDKQEDVLKELRDIVRERW